jgi:hypothetical protein
MFVLSLGTLKLLTDKSKVLGAGGNIAVHPTPRKIARAKIIIFLIYPPKISI